MKGTSMNHRDALISKLEHQSAVIGIVGLGALGGAIAQRAAAMRRRLRYATRNERSDGPYERVPDVREEAMD